MAFAAGPAFAQDEPPAGAPYSPYPASVLVTKVEHFAKTCWKIAAAGGTLYFETGEKGGSTGFNSAFDEAGNDWIGNDADNGDNKSPSGGGDHEYRGWPNFGEEDFDHPQRGSGSSTRWVDAAGNDVAFADKLEGDHLIMRSSNAQYEVEYHFFTSHAAIKVLKADGKYAFLFEGPIGGEQEKAVEKDYYVLKDGKPRALTGTKKGYLDPEFGNRFPSPFFYLVDSDPKDTQVWYIGAKDFGPETAGDEGWIQGTNMVIFSYGRDEDKRAYTGTDAVSVFGFHKKDAGHEAISAFIEARLAAPFVAGGSDPVGGTGGASGMGGAAAGGAATAGAPAAGGGADTSGGGTVAVPAGGAPAGGGAPAAGGTAPAAGGTTPAAGGAVAAGGAMAAGGAPGAAGGSGAVVAPVTTSSSDDGGCAVAPSSRGLLGGGLPLFMLGLLSLRRRRAPKTRSVA